MLGSYILELKQDLNTRYFLYNIKPNKEDIELLGLIKAQNRQINMLIRIAINIILRDNMLKKGLWVYAEPLYVFNLFITWLKGVVT
jgi:hypothetical protein